MFLLPHAVLDHRHLRGMAHAERTAASLPRDPHVGTAVFTVQPEDRVRFEQADQIGQCQRWRAGHEQMDMIGCAVDGWSGGTGFARDAAQIGKHVGTQYVINPGATFLGGKNHVGEQQRQRVGHADFLTPLPGL